MVSRGTPSERDGVLEGASECEETVLRLLDEPIGSGGIEGRGIGVEAFAFGEAAGDPFDRELEARGEGVTTELGAAQDAPVEDNASHSETRSHDAPAEDTSDLEPSAA